VRQKKPEKGSRSTWKCETKPRSYEECWMTDEADNVVYLKPKPKVNKVPRASVPAVCGIAAKMMDSAVIVGTAADGSVKMMTTIEDVAEVIWHLEAAKHSLMSGDFEE